jgi:protein TonB
MATHLISAPPPAYPLLARMAHVRGQVTVEAIISSSGAVSAARATDGHHLLRAAAEAAVRQRRYRPYRIGGQAVNVSTLITVDFGDPT